MVKETMATGDEVTALRRQIARLVGAMNDINDAAATAVVSDNWSKDEIWVFYQEVLERISELARYSDEDIAVSRDIE